MADYETVEPFFNFETKDFVLINGGIKLVNGKRRIQNWINKLLRTQINENEIHKGTGYGVNIKTIVGKSFSTEYVKSEIKREITEALLKNTDIIRVDDFLMELDGSRLTVGFTVSTVYGSITISEKEW